MSVGVGGVALKQGLILGEDLERGVMKWLLTCVN